MARLVPPEEAIGTPNGVRTIFRTNLAYLPGTLRVWRNGQLLLARFDPGGFKELGGNRFEFRDAPLSGDVIQVLYYI